MNEAAKRIYSDMRAEARAEGKSIRHGLVCTFYPGSDRFNWWIKGRVRDITLGLNKRQVISLINLDIGDKT